jgi:RHS repeat-associated protein
LLRDGVGRVKQVTNARLDVEKYFFDDDGNMTAVENGNGKTRSYGYTDRSELQAIYFADGNTEKYKFDGNGNQTQRINGMQQTIGYSYDSVDNLTLVDYPSGIDTTIGYDNDGRQTVMYDGTGGSGWSYDWADNVTQLVTPQGTMDYVYDQWNRQTKLKEGTIETNYGFTNQRLSTITKSTDGVSTALNYDQYGRLTEKNDGATRTMYGYDTNDRVSSIVHSKTSNNQVLHQETYNYDPANNLLSKLVNSVATSYTYDFIDQLKTENSSSLSNTYAYDNNGNRTSRISNAGTDTYTYDNGDKLTGIARSYGAGSTYTYDGCGRTSTISGSSGTRMFTWDFEDRLTNISGGGVPSTNYGYNGVGSRVSKSNTLGSRTYKRNGVEVTAPVLSDGVATMVPGISEKSGGVTSTILSDRMGSTKGLTNADAVTYTVEFDAFGKVVSSTGTNATQKGFVGNAGYQEDGESGYKLLGHRYYDPETGRFLSRDRAGDGRNWYSYCDNSPLKAIDKDGLKKKLLIIVGATYYPTFLGMNSINSWIQLMIADIVARYGLLYDIEILYAPTREEAMGKMTDADAFIFLGHGYSGGLDIGTNGGPPNATDLDPADNGGYRRLSAADIKKVAKARAKKGKGKMDFVELYACNSCQSKEFIDAWYGIADAILGYDTGTLDGIPKYFTPSAPTIKSPAVTRDRGRGSN